MPESKTFPSGRTFVVGSNIRFETDGVVSGGKFLEGSSGFGTIIGFSVFLGKPTIMIESLYVHWGAWDRWKVQDDARVGWDRSVTKGTHFFNRILVNGLDELEVKDVCSIPLD